MKVTYADILNEISRRKSINFKNLESLSDEQLMRIFPEVELPTETATNTYKIYETKS